MATGNSKKRPHKTLTIDEKVEILDQIGKKSYTVISEEYGIGRATITDIKRKEVEIRNFKSHMLKMEPGVPAKIMKLGKDEEHDKAGLNNSVKKEYPLQVGRIVKMIHNSFLLSFQVLHVS